MLRKVHLNMIDLAVSSFRLRSYTNELHLLKANCKPKLEYDSKILNSKFLHFYYHFGLKLSRAESS